MKTSPCWEIVVSKMPVLTVHRAGRARAVEYAQGVAARLVTGEGVRLRCVRCCVCEATGRPQPAVGPTSLILTAPAHPEAT